jgi:acetyl-CoA synthetase
VHTGKPKGVKHTTAGFMVHAYMTCKYVFNLNVGDVMWNTGDCGWATGHTCLCYGPQLNGAIAVIYEGIPSYPDHSHMWQVCCAMTRFTAARSRTA